MVTHRQGAFGLLIWAGLCAAACNGTEADSAPLGSKDDKVYGSGGVDAATGGTVEGSGGLLVLPAAGGTGGLPDFGEGGADPTCAETGAATTLRTVRLAFLFDVSGSMGKHDYEWHDPALKWEPVVAGTKAFFVDPASVGLEASLAFFPAEDDRCEPEMYLEPEVPFTQLPSEAFGAAIDAVTPESEDDWRGGTPTLAAITGTVERLTPLVEAELEATYAIVLVTDGYPQSCDDNSIESVEAAVSAVAETIPTYVIGVRNPPVDDAPDTVSDLNAIAVAGGTEQAFFIDTGKPAVTTADLLNVVNGIRSQTLTCDLDIPPPPPGRELDPQRVKVTYTTAAVATDLPYDPSCANGGGWHYDDPVAPTMIHLCPDTCAAVQGDAEAELAVAFACEVTIEVLY